MSSDTAGQAIENPTVDTESTRCPEVVPEPPESTGVPLLVAEKTPDDDGVHDTTPGSEAHEKTMDAQPSVLQESEGVKRTDDHPNLDAAISTSAGSCDIPGPSKDDSGTPPPSSIPLISPTSAIDPQTVTGIHIISADNGDDDFDDFDDFGETVDDGDGFDDFGDFDTAEPVPQVNSENIETDPIHNLAYTKVLPDFAKLSTEELKIQIDDILGSLYDAHNDKTPRLVQAIPPTNSAFLTERSQSLWTQLCTPPPLQPPNWKLSRIRRLFLVSLGVPVDLDEILPADTKQKKLVLPSSSHTRKSSDMGRSDGDRSNRSSSRRRKEKEAQSKLVDMPSARILCSTSDVKLRTFTVVELEEHVKKLEEITREASETLTYWLEKRETALGDKEAFERVIENLVEFAKKKR